MSVTRSTVRTAAKALAQDGAPGGVGVGVQLLLTDPADYNICIDQALAMFVGDVPNPRVVHYPLTTTAFRFVLAGTGAILVPQPPALPALTITGGASTARSYRVAARNAIGQGLWSQAAQTAVGPVALDASHKVKIDWAAVPGATSYDVFGRDGGVEQLLRNVAGTSYTDDGTDTPSGLLGTAGLDGWILDGSELTKVWMPYFAGVAVGVAQQGQQPIPDNEWHTFDEPGPTTLLEFYGLASTPSTTLRLEFTSPHVVDENSAAYTSIRPKWVTAFTTLAAALLLRLVANRYLQNTGITGLPNDIVDRRSQSDQAASRAKEMLLIYRDLIGGGEPRGAASGFKEMDVVSSHNRGSLWHPTSIR